MRLLFFLTLLFVTFFVSGQALIFPDSFRLESVSFYNELPTDLLQKKSAVIYLTDREGWKEKAAEVQKGLKKAGVDAVAHFHIHDIFSGKESKRAYGQQITDREIDFLVYYDDKDIHELIIFPFADTFIPDSAFRLTNTNSQDLFRQLFVRASRSNQPQTNLLILEVPAYMDFPKVIEGRRAEFYDLNMKSGKLAIPRMEDSLLNNEFDSIMKAYYPFNYGFVEPGLSESELRKEGYWFIMYGIKGPGKLVRNLLEYATTKEETVYASVVTNNGHTEVKRYPVDQPVVKFYIKDVQNKDLYLGKHYDADITWQAALKNYVINLKNILGG